MTIASPTVGGYVDGVRVRSISVFPATHARTQQENVTPELRLRCSSLGWLSARNEALRLEPMRQKELDALLTYLIPIAKAKLASAGEFAPFGGVVQSSGDLKVFTTEIEGECPEADVVAETLFDQFGLMAEAGEITAAAACFNAVVANEITGEDMPAIVVRCEDSQEAIDVYQTYELNAVDELVFGPLTGGPGRARLFVSS